MQVRIGFGLWNEPEPVEDKDDDDDDSESSSGQAVNNAEE